MIDCEYVKDLICRNLANYGKPEYFIKIEKLFIYNTDRIIVAVISEDTQINGTLYSDMPVFYYGFYSIYSDSVIAPGTVEYRRIEKLMPSACIPDFSGCGFMEYRSMERKETEFIDEYLKNGIINPCYLELLSRQEEMTDNDQTRTLVHFFIPDPPLPEKDVIPKETSESVVTEYSSHAVSVVGEFDVHNISRQQRQGSKNGHIGAILVVSVISGIMGIVTAIMLVL